MKKPISIALVAACSLAGAAAQAQPQNIYARIDTGGSFSTNAGKDVAVDICSSPPPRARAGGQLPPLPPAHRPLSLRPGPPFSPPPPPPPPPRPPPRRRSQTPPLPPHT